MNTTKPIPPELVTEMQARLDTVSPRAGDYDARLASFAWRPIAEYDKALAPTVLLRHGEHACAGSWAAATLFRDDEPGETWRSAEDATLEMPLQFGPEEFAVLDEETLPGFIGV